MNFRLIANTTSYVLWVEAGFLLLPLAASVLYGEAWLPFSARRCCASCWARRCIWCR